MRNNKYFTPVLAFLLVAAFIVACLTGCASRHRTMVKSSYDSSGATSAEISQVQKSDAAILRHEIATEKSETTTKESTAGVYVFDNTYSGQNGYTEITDGATIIKSNLPLISYTSKNKSKSTLKDTASKSVVNISHAFTYDSLKATTQQDSKVHSESKAVNVERKSWFKIWYLIPLILLCAAGFPAYYEYKKKNKKLSA